MLNSPAFLKRKLKNYRTLNKVGEVNLQKSVEALSEVQQQKLQIDEQLEKTEQALNQSAVFYQHQGDQLVPELMGNQSLYVSALVTAHQEHKKAQSALAQDVDSKLSEVFKLKKTNEVVASKMHSAQQQMLELYHRRMDAEIAEVVQQTTGEQD